MIDEIPVKDGRAAAKDFMSVVWPRIKKIGWFGPGARIEQIEWQENSATRELDTGAGIDVLFSTVKGIFLAASRVQWQRRRWDTFTIRYDRGTGLLTEYGKTKRAISNGSAYPQYYIHAYLNERSGKLTSVARCETINLYTYIEENGDVWIKNHSKLATCDGKHTWFIYIPWEDLLDAGINVNIWPSRKLRVPPFVHQSKSNSEPDLDGSSISGDI
jgi:hypothetical protein